MLHVSLGDIERSGLFPDVAEIHNLDLLGDRILMLLFQLEGLELFTLKEGDLMGTCPLVSDSQVKE